MALATSEASARVGRGLSIIDSSICVAVMTGLRYSAARQVDVFLQRGDFFGRDFNSKISASDHDGVGHLEDRIKMFDSLWFFEFGDHPGVGFERRETVFDVADIRGRADEGDCDDINTLADCEDEIFFILFGQ